MGTINSGRRYKPEEVRQTVESAIKLDMTFWRQEGVFKPGHSFDIFQPIDPLDRFLIRIHVGEQSLRAEYQFQKAPRTQVIDFKSIHIMGARPRHYLSCPRCGSRRNQLYLGSDGWFSCRACLNLTFRVQQLNPSKRHAHVARKLRRKKLGLPEDTPAHGIKKPEGMWSKNFERVLNQIREKELAAAQCFISHARDLIAKHDLREALKNPSPA